MKNKKNLNMNLIIHIVMAKREDIYSFIMVVLTGLGFYYLYYNYITSAFILLGIVFTLAVFKKRLLD